MKWGIFAELQVQDLDQPFNGLDIKELDHTYNRETKCIYLIVATLKIIKNKEGSVVFEANEIMNTDHRELIVDINLV